MRHAAPKYRQIVPTLAAAFAALSPLCSAPARGQGGATVAGETPRLVLTVAPLYSYVVLDEQEEPSGGGCALTLAYQLTEAIAVQLGGLWSAHELAATEQRPGGALHLIGIAAAGRYALDALPFAPALEAGVELLHRRLAGAAATDFAVLVGLSARHWVRPWLALGVQLYYHAFLTDLTKFPIFVNIGPTVAIRF